MEEVACWVEKRGSRRVWPRSPGRYSPCDRQSKNAPTFSRLGMTLAAAVLVSSSASAAPASLFEQGADAAGQRPAAFHSWAVREPQRRRRAQGSGRGGFQFDSVRSPISPRWIGCNSSGPRLWVNVGGALDLSQNATSHYKQLAETVQRVGRHPALLVWEGPDEILWNNWWGTMERLRPELETIADHGGREGGIAGAGPPGTGLFRARALRGFRDRARRILAPGRSTLTESGRANGRCRGPRQPERRRHHRRNS